MWCPLCKKYHQRGTDTYPSDCCYDCLRDYVLPNYEYIEPSIEDKIKNYEQYIEWAKESIKEHKAEIEIHSDNIDFWKNEITKLILNR